MAYDGLTREELWLEVQELRRQLAAIQEAAQAQEQNLGEQLRVAAAEQLQLAQALEATQGRMQAVIDCASEAIVLTDAQGRVILANSAAARLYARPILQGEDFLSDAQFGLCHADGRPYRREELPLWRSLTSGEAVVAEDMALRSQSGASTHLSASSAPIRDRQGGIVAAVLTYSDVTGRHRTEEALHQIEARYRSLVEMSPDAIMVHADGKIIFVNPAAVKLFAVSGPEDLLGRRILDLVHYSCRAAVEDRIHNPRDGATNGPGEFKAVRADGEVIDVEATGSGITYQGQPAVQVMLRDITEKKRAREALRESEERYRSLFENNHAVMLLIDPETADIVDANPVACGYYGYSREELASRKITDINTLTPEEVFQEMQRAKAEERNYFEFEHRLASGEIRDVEVFSGPIRVKGRELLYSIIHDITERKQAEEAVRLSNQRRIDILESIRDGFFSCDREMVVTYFNAAAGKLLGRGRNEVLGRNLFDAFPEARGSVLEEKFTEALREGKPLSFETFFEPEPYWNWYDIRVFPYEGGISVYFDVTTERKQTEAALRESQRDLNRAQAVAHTGSWRLDVRRNELSWSDETHRIFGIAPGKPLTYETFLAAVHPDDREYVDRKWQAALQGEQYDIEHRIVVDGVVKWVRERAELEFDSQGRLAGGFGTAQDITGRKQAQAEIERLASFPQLNPNPVLEVDAGGAITYANAAALEALRLSGLQDARAFLPTDMADIFAEAGETGQSDFSREIEVQGRNFAAFISFPPDLGVARIYLLDTTERKQAEEALRRAHEDLENQVRARTVELRIVNEHLWLEIKVRRQAEAALKTERQRLFSVLEQIPAYVVLLAPDHTIPYANGEFIRRFGEPGTKRCYDLLFSLDQPCEGCKALEVFESQIPAVWEWCGPDGNTYQIYDYPFIDADGSPLVLEMGLDISARKAAEQNLRWQSAILNGINRVFREALTCETEAELDRTCLGVLEELSGSPCGFIGKVNAEGRLDTMVCSDPAWAARSRGDNYKRPLELDPRLQDLKEEVLKMRGSLIVNEPASRFGALDQASNRPALRAFLGVPLQQGGQVIGLIGLANKPGGYDQNDQEAGEIIGAAFVEALMRKRAERQAASIGRLYRLLSRVNETIVRAADQNELFQEVCRIAVEEGQFCMVWIGLADKDTGVIRPVAQYGVGTDYLDQITVSIRSEPESLGPAGTAVRAGRYDICEDIASEPPMAPWREQALARGYRSSAAFPLRVGRRVVGALSFYADRTRFFNEDEIAVLESLASDLSFALHSMDREAKRRQAEEALQASEVRLRYLASRLLHAQESERRRLALELHDDLGQSLMVLKMQLRAIEKMLPADHWQAREQCAQTLKYINTVVENVRRLSRDLRPAALEDLGLPAALRFLTEDFSKYHGIDLSLEMDDIEGLFNHDEQVNIYRIFQETLTNIAKHAQASRVMIAIKRQDNRVSFQVADNGRGFDPEKSLARDSSRRGLGLAALDERVRMLGSRLDIRSQEGQGTTISFYIPLTVKRPPDQSAPPGPGMGRH